MPSNPEDIMAEYLLKGGKMLDKTCPSCGSPLFLVKGDTMCVVCSKAQGEAQAQVREITKDPIQKQPESAPEDYVEIFCGSEESDISRDLKEEIEKTIIHLCRRVRQESRPEDCLALMECITIANDVLKGR